MRLSTVLKRHTVQSCLLTIMRRIHYSNGTAVAQWLRRCAKNRKVQSQLVSLEFFTDIKSFRSYYGPGVDSASNRNEYQEYFLGWTPYKTRPAGRPRLRRMDQVEEDLKRMKIIGWRAKVEDRQEWNRIVEQTKTHPGL